MALHTTMIALTLSAVTCLPLIRDGQKASQSVPLPAVLLDLAIIVILLFLFHSIVLRPLQRMHGALPNIPGEGSPGSSQRKGYEPHDPRPDSADRRET